MTFEALDVWWWPYLFILIGGWAATDLWRYLGVLLGNRMSEDSDAMVLVRTIATALVAAVIGNLVVFPSGALSATPMALRIAAAGIGFATYIVSRRRMLLGIFAAEAVLLGGFAALG